MKIQDHLDKVARYEDLRSRLHQVDDFELRVWAAMNSATNLLNACLHHLGVTDPGVCFPHQIPGVYVEPEKKNGRWKLVMVAPGDVIHIGLPPVEKEIPAAIMQLSDSLEVIEHMREPHIRGDQPVPAGLLDACDVAYERCSAAARKILATPKGSAA
jgi:hypothetical protein